MDILALRELCDECLSIEAQMLSNKLTAAQRGDLGRARAITIKSIENVVNGTGPEFQSEIS